MISYSLTENSHEKIWLYLYYIILSYGFITFSEFFTLIAARTYWGFEIHSMFAQTEYVQTVCIAKYQYIEYNKTIK